MIEGKDTISTHTPSSSPINWTLEGDAFVCIGKRASLTRTTNPKERLPLRQGFPDAAVVATEAVRTSLINDRNRGHPDLARPYVFWYGR